MYIQFSSNKYKFYTLVVVELDKKVVVLESRQNLNVPNVIVLKYPGNESFTAKPPSRRLHLLDAAHLDVPLIVTKRDIMVLQRLERLLRCFLSLA